MRKGETIWQDQIDAIYRLKAFEHFEIDFKTYPTFYNTLKKAIRKVPLEGRLRILRMSKDKVWFFVIDKTK